MDTFGSYKTVEYKHRAAPKQRRLGTVVIGLSVTLCVANGLFVATEYKQRQTERDEYRAAYPAIDDYLYFQGYTDRVKLRVDIDNNDFSFINLSDETGPNICVGSYTYRNKHDIHVGAIACAKLENSERPVPGNVPV